MVKDPEGKEGDLIHRCLGDVAGHVVEVGCGDGRLTGNIAQVARTLVAVDPALEEISAARNTVGKSVWYIAARGESLPLVENSVDTVVFTFSLHHQDPVIALNEACRLLRKGGRILVMEPIKNSLLNLLFAVLHDESREYDRAEAAINNSGLIKVQTGSVKTAWVFEDFDGMVGYLFDYYGMEPEREKKKEMVQLLGEHRTLKPLRIEDITRFWLLG